MRIGITGIRGFIGIHLQKRIRNSIAFNGDLKDIRKVREFILNCDRIYHLAGKNREKFGVILKNNIIATANLTLAMTVENKSPEIILASSKQVIWNSNSEYGLTKILEEEIVKKAKKWCIYRIPNVYGPGCKPFYNSVVATFCYKVSRRKPLTINDPDATREFIYIDDLIDKLLDPEFNAYKELHGEVMSISEIASYLTDRLGHHKKLQRCLEYYKKEVTDVPNS